MKITVPHAKTICNTIYVAKEKSLEQIVERYLNEVIGPAICKAAGSCVNEAIPTEAYQHGNSFYELCTLELAKLGYNAEKSHDGCGMYSTLCVTWKPKVTTVKRTA